MNGLLDTNVFIDLLRSYPAALLWMQSNRLLTFGIPAIARMELVWGARDKVEMQRIVKLMNPFPVVHLNAADSVWALREFESYHLSHQVEIADCFIAAMRVRLQLPIYTRNLRDFKILPAVTVHVPYT
ncbi:MAG: PIN domain-containing protein [Anaerolineae bacterium]